MKPVSGIFLARHGLAVISFLLSLLTLHARADAATLDVVMTSSDATTMWVEVRFLDYNLANPCAQAATCKWEYMSGSISPCPLAGGGWCENGSTRWPGAIDEVVHLQLELGRTYSIEADRTTIGFRPEMGGGCFEPYCNYGEGASKIFSATPVATARATWGKIKALYVNQ